MRRASARPYTNLQEASQIFSESLSFPTSETFSRNLERRGINQRRIFFDVESNDFIEWQAAGSPPVLPARGQKAIAHLDNSREVKGPERRE